MVWPTLRSRTAKNRTDSSASARRNKEVAIVIITTVRIAAAAQINPPYSVQADFALTTTDDGGDLVFALLGYKAV